MNDMVRRIKKTVLPTSPFVPIAWLNLLVEASDEIERLEAMVDSLRRDSVRAEDKEKVAIDILSEARDAIDDLDGIRNRISTYIK